VIGYTVRVWVAVPGDANQHAAGQRDFNEITWRHLETVRHAIIIRARKRQRQQDLDTSGRCE